MAYPGAWEQPADQAATLGNLEGIASRRLQARSVTSGGSWATVTAEALAGADTTGSGAPGVFAVPELGDLGGGAVVKVTLLMVSRATLSSYLPVFDPRDFTEWPTTGMPPGATGWEFEDDDYDPVQVDLHLSVTLDHTDAATSGLDGMVLAGELGVTHVDGGGGSYSLTSPWVSSTQLGALPQLALLAADTTTTVTVAVGMDPQYPVGSVALIPAAAYGGSTWPQGQDISGSFGGANLDVVYAPPRFRWLYSTGVLKLMTSAGWVKVGCPVPEGTTGLLKLQAPDGWYQVRCADDSTPGVPLKLMLPWGAWADAACMVPSAPATEPGSALQSGFPGVPVADPSGALTVVGSDPVLAPSDGAYVEMVPGGPWALLDAVPPPGIVTASLTYAELAVHVHTSSGQSVVEVQVRGSSGVIRTMSNLMLAGLWGGSADCATGPELAGFAAAVDDGSLQIAARLVSKTDPAATVRWDVALSYAEWS